MESAGRQTDYEVRFTVRNAKVKVLRSAKSNVYLDLVDAYEEMKIDCPTRTDYSPMKTDHTEVRVSCEKRTSTLY